MAWSPNGQTLAFATGIDPSTGLASIAVTDRAGRIIDTPLKHEFIQALDWSPDGKQIVYVCHPTTTSGDSWQLCLVDVATGAHRMLITPANALQAFNTSRVSWSPKGDEIAFDSQLPITCDVGVAPPCVGNVVAVVNVTTGATTSLTNPLEFAGAPAFSPDGSEIAYFARAAVAGSLPGST